MIYKLINPGYLDTVSGGDPELISEIVGLFREQVKEITGEMRISLDKKDYLQLGMLAHKAKSSVAIMGMDELANMLKAFELSAKAGENTELYIKYIERFQGDTEDALSELDDLISNRLKTS